MRDSCCQDDVFLLLRWKHSHFSVYLWPSFDHLASLSRELSLLIHLINPAVLITAVKLHWLDLRTLAVLKVNFTCSLPANFPIFRNFSFYLFFSLGVRAGSPSSNVLSTVFLAESVLFAPRTILQGKRTMTWLYEWFAFTKQYIKRIKKKL